MGKRYFYAPYIKSPTSDHVCPKKDVGGLSLIPLYYKYSLKPLPNYVLSIYYNICFVMN